ncbi:MAG TPA: TetR family transcriptional regulator [Acidimicrobiia bacterium]|nr:TetR family transcriptional regulator [Acidimicrobiia bacterium]
MGRRGDAARQSLLSAAERILAHEGAAALTTRRIATEAELNQSVVHYYFGSLDNLCAQLLDRVSRSLISRQKEIFSSAEPFAAQWAQATAPLRSDRDAVKVWVELSALALNNAQLKAMLVAADDEWTGILVDAFDRQWRRSGGDEGLFPSRAYAGLTLAFLKGLYLEHALGRDGHHAEVLELSGRLLESFDGQLLARLLG